MIGSFMGLTFSVSDSAIYTIEKMAGSAGMEYQVHDSVIRKGKIETIAPKLRSYTIDIKLRAQDGPHPRETVELFQNYAELGRADYFVIGNRPLSQNRFKITECSDSWDEVIANGILVECSLTLQIEEYI